MALVALGDQLDRPGACFLFSRSASALTMSASTSSSSSRSNHHQADTAWPAKVVTQDDPRVTPASARFHRARTILDELPTAPANGVSRASLSGRAASCTPVGRAAACPGLFLTRPSMAFHRAAPAVNPGNHRCAQINGFRRESPRGKDPEALEFDLCYNRNWSLLFDLYNPLLKRPLALMRRTRTLTDARLSTCELVNASPGLPGRSSILYSRIQQPTLGYGIAPPEPSSGLAECETPVAGHERKSFNCFCFCVRVACFVMASAAKAGELPPSAKLSRACLRCNARLGLAGPALSHCYFVFIEPSPYELVDPHRTCCVLWPPACGLLRLAFMPLLLVLLVPDQSRLQLSAVPCSSICDRIWIAPHPSWYMATP